MKLPHNKRRELYPSLEEDMNPSKAKKKRLKKKRHGANTKLKLALAAHSADSDMLLEEKKTISELLSQSMAKEMAGAKALVEAECQHRQQLQEMQQHVLQSYQLVQRLPWESDETLAFFKAEIEKQQRFRLDDYMNFTYHMRVQQLEKHMSIQIREREEQVREELRELALCPVCRERPRNCTFTCGHQTCMDCGEKMSRCHLCRQPVVVRVRTYM